MEQTVRVGNLPGGSNWFPAKLRQSRPLLGGNIVTRRRQQGQTLPKSPGPGQLSPNAILTFRVDDSGQRQAARRFPRSLIEERLGNSRRLF
jgi:hypothetical protein